MANATGCGYGVFYHEGNMTTSPATSHVLPEPAAASVLVQLRSKNFAALDEQLGEMQARFEQGELDERDLLAAFQPFEATDAALGEQFGGWMEALPGSYPAHVALASWMLARAWSFRGGATYDRVSDRGRRGMAHFLEQAEACARHATTLSANPLAAWVVVAGVTRTQGNQLALEQIERGEWPDWYAQPLETNPGSLTLRRNMLLYLRTEWGGSDAMMLAYLRSQEGQLSNQAKQRLWAQYHSQVSHHALHFAKDDALALERAQMAADLYPAESIQLLVVLMALPQIKVGSQVRQAAFERVMTYLETSPDATVSGNAPFALLSFLEGKSGMDLTRAASTLSKLAEQGDEDALALLGRLAARHKKRLAEHLEVAPMLRQAAERGDAEAAAILADFHHADPADYGAYDAALLLGANLAEPGCAWQTYQGWSRFEGTQGLTDRDKLRFLLLAADNGNNGARVELSGLLRAGQAELGEDGVLRPIAGKPIQASLDYAKHLLERASHEGEDAAAKALKRANEGDWQEATARIQKMSGAARLAAVPTPPGRIPWGVIWLLILAGSAILRACVPH
jgi:Domain of unknown function (DUF4034)